VEVLDGLSAGERVVISPVSPGEDLEALDIK
jgi:hypothetical protein